MISARSYRPQSAAAGEPLALVVYFHGGGWLLGSVESHDTVCRALANASGAVVLNVGYRLAPEARFPAAPDDALAATRWAHANAALLGADPARLAVAGDSAGGNLAAVVCQDLRDAGEPIVRFQLLVYPVTTADLAIGFDMTYEGYFLYRDEMLWHQEHYLASPDEARNPRVSPLLGNGEGSAPGRHPGGGVRPAPPAGRALSRPADRCRRTGRLHAVPRDDPRLLRPREHLRRLRRRDGGRRLSPARRPRLSQRPSRGSGRG